MKANKKRNIFLGGGFVCQALRIASPALRGRGITTTAREREGVPAEPIFTGTPGKKELLRSTGRSESPSAWM
jgi:hypothetical protein